MIYLQGGHHIVFLIGVGENKGSNEDCPPQRKTVWIPNQRSAILFLNEFIINQIKYHWNNHYYILTYELKRGKTRYRAKH
jgi:hypothetical protein